MSGNFPLNKRAVSRGISPSAVGQVFFAERKKAAEEGAKIFFLFGEKKCQLRQRFALKWYFVVLEKTGREEFLCAESQD